MKRLIGTIVVLLLVSAVVFITVPSHNAKIRQYEEGVTHFKNNEYEEALQCFSSLGSFKDSKKMTEFAQMELDYLQLDALVNAGNYEKVIEILEKRSELYGDSDSGKEAMMLADEYGIVSNALTALKSGNYALAVDYFNDLTVLKDDYSRENCLCLAHIAEEEQNWIDIINNLYAIQSGDFGFGFLSNPQNEGEILLSEFVSLNSNDDLNVLSELLQPDDSEFEHLKTVALNGLRYDTAKEQMELGNFEKSMEVFEELGEFLDSASLYEEAKVKYDSLEDSYLKAEEYFENEEYYKAKKQYLSCGDYKDALTKAEDCEQPLPENGALKFGNGSSIGLSIKNTDSSESVFLKLYDLSDTCVGQVFIRAGNKATVNMNSGTYTIKVGYGEEWYGEKDLFGENGGYQQLMNGGYSSNFSFENGYDYELTLGGVTNGNVGSKNIGGAEGM